MNNIGPNVQPTSILVNVKTRFRPKILGQYISAKMIGIDDSLLLFASPQDCAQVAKLFSDTFLDDELKLF